MSRAKTTTFKLGRDAGDGRFKPVASARRDHDGSVVETIRRPVTPQPSKPKK